MAAQEQAQIDRIIVGTRRHLAEALSHLSPNQLSYGSRWQPQVESMRRDMYLGGLRIIAGGPVSDNGICIFSAFGGVTLDTGYTMLNGVIGTGKELVWIQQSGSGTYGQLVPVPNKPSNFRLLQQPVERYAGRSNSRR